MFHNSYPLDVVSFRDFIINMKVQLITNRQGYFHLTYYFWKRGWDLTVRKGLLGLGSCVPVHSALKKLLSVVVCTRSPSPKGMAGFLSSFHFKNRSVFQIYRLNT